MKNRVHQVRGDVFQIIETLHEVSLHAGALAQGATLAAARSGELHLGPEERRSLEAMADGLDRIVAQARRIDHLVDAVSDAAVADTALDTVARELHGPAAELREAVTALVLLSCGVTGSRQNSAV